MGNYVIAGVGNYVIENPSDLGNFMIADTDVPPPPMIMWTVPWVVSTRWPCRSRQAAE